MTYLIVGLDRRTLARWYEHVLAGDVGTATRIARARAAAQGVKLIVAAVIGPNSCLLEDPEEQPAADERAAQRWRLGDPDDDAAYDLVVAVASGPADDVEEIAQPWCGYVARPAESRCGVDGSADDRVSSLASARSASAETTASRRGWPQANEAARLVRAATRQCPVHGNR